MLPKLPLDKWVDAAVDWIESSLGFVLDPIAAGIEGAVEGISYVLHLLPALAMIVLLAALAWRFMRWKMALFTLVGLFLIDNLGYWDHTMDTLALVLTSAIVSIVIGIPIGIACARSKRTQQIVTPILDFMQTMPAFVYLIPAVTFFNLGVVPGVIASVIFAVPPTIRLTNLGIRQVPADLVEAADSFGSTPAQKLVKVQLPLAVPSIMAGINQTIMLALSMVVIASLIGAQGIGADVYRAVSQIKTGKGFEAGLAIVILAIFLDRLTQHLVKGKRQADRRG
ncbi:ABC transporter permease [Paenibacillus pasadenensis]|uniref:Glycine betaine ABC transport system, permease protein OpuAB n=1 Tax=Paenibacillus pasadenensis TaxID=217090 RepID=A0A2N5N2F1_9BACL|nr:MULTISPECIES: proline/glycine betaine ABC transporter permease [Paenibacillus]PLT44502.1 Glycine betaine ABC transport system, permease protein OpuAB [Paenibacillus pasadenensis]QGG54970.1 ABC transporter permease subunit [Paenibacillus sp. B01]